MQARVSGEITGYHLLATSPDSHASFATFKPLSTEFFRVVEDVAHPARHELHG